jgi:hypothetical protein
VAKDGNHSLLDPDLLRLLLFLPMRLLGRILLVQPLYDVAQLAIIQLDVEEDFAVRLVDRVHLLVVVIL